MLFKNLRQLLSSRPEMAPKIEIPRGLGCSSILEFSGWELNNWRQFLKRITVRVSHGLKAYDVVVNELGMCLRKKNAMTCGWLSNIAWMNELLGVCNGRRRGIVETTRA